MKGNVLVNVVLLVCPTIGLLKTTPKWVSYTGYYFDQICV